MFVKDNPHSFLTGDDPFLPVAPVEVSHGSYNAELTFEYRHEGFIGIPHGGLAMGLCLDMWRRTGAASYPLNVRFKFGGSGIAIGDNAVFSMETIPEGQDQGALAKITKNGDKTPYLVAEMAPAPHADPPLWYPDSPSSNIRLLPYYRNCFVCGHHREIPGLCRRFRRHDDEDGEIVVTVPWGLDSDDFDRADLFRIGRDELHPAVLMAMFDENTAWAGFMLTRQAGLSVRMEVTLLRPVAKDERLLFVGHPTGIRGNPRSPRFFLGEGTVLAIDDSGNAEPVAYGCGEWLVVKMYTEQIKKNLLPADDWGWIFSSEDTTNCGVKT